MTKHLNVWNMVTGLFGVLILWLVVKQMLPATVPFSGSLLLLIGISIAAAVVLGGEILIKKNSLTATSEKMARLVSTTLGLLVAVITVANVWTLGLPNLGGWMQGWGSFFSITTLAVVTLAGIILNGLYWEMKEGKGTISRVVFRVAAIVLILGALLTWLIGEQLISRSGQALQDGTRSQLSAWLDGKPTTNFTFDGTWLALGVLGLIFVLGLWKKEKVPTPIMVLITVFWLPFIFWTAWAGLPAKYKEDVREVTASITPDFITITPEEREAARKAKAERLAANRKAEAERLAAEDKARREEELHQAKVRGAETAAYEAEAEKNKPLTEAAFTTKTIGVFEPITIKSGERVGPINFYKDTCFYWSKSGMGMFFAYSRTDFVSEPVLAEFVNQEYAIKSWNQPSAPVQVFLEAQKGDIQIELERRAGSESCK